MAQNIITASFPSGIRQTKTLPLWQYDYGQILEVVGLSLPAAWEAHFANEPRSGTASVSIGTGNQVLIPDAYLVTGKPVYCWIFLHDDENSGETEYNITIPVSQRPLPSDEQPTPEEQSVIEQIMGALTAAAEQAETQAGNAEASAEAAAASATDAAASAQSAEEDASAAANAASAAERSADAAAQSESTAAAAAESAGESKEAAAGSAASAETAADRAEQAANTAGYMFVEIDENGHLVYERTDQVTADLDLNASGHLILQGV